MYKFNDTQLSDWIIKNQFYFDLCEVDIRRAYYTLYNRFHKVWGWDSLPPDEKLANNTRIGKISKHVLQDDCYRAFLKHYFKTMLWKNPKAKVYQTIKDAIIVDDLINAESGTSGILKSVVKYRYKIVIFLDLNSMIGLTKDNELVVKGSFFQTPIMLRNVMVDILNVIYQYKQNFTNELSYIYGSNVKNSILKYIDDIIDIILYQENLAPIEIIRYFGVYEDNPKTKVYYLENGSEIKIPDEQIERNFITKIFRQKYFDANIFTFLKIVMENLS